MWMMMDTNNEHGREYKLPADHVIGRKLRPLMPRPISSSSNNPFSTLLSTPSACCCIRNPNILSWNHSTSDECCGVKREAAVPLVSTRWNPTAEQLQALEEMYRRGIRTPSAEQIQQIAAKLGRFGKIEGKNVFYWFQNHKARERQKKRRQLELLAVAGKKMHHAHAIHTKHQTPGLSRRYIEIEHHKKVPIPSNCSTASEDSASMHGAVIAAEAVCGKDGCNHKELQHKVGSAAAENESGCCQLHLDLSSCLPLNNAITKGRENANTLPTSINLITMLAPNITDDNLNRRENEHEVKEDQTLELFPSPRPRGGGGEIRHHTFTIGTKVAPSQFIEFLPIKN